MSKQKQQQAEPVQAKMAKHEIQPQKTAVASPIPSMQHVYADPRTLTQATAAALQRMVGNQTMGRLVVQRKMTVGPVNDPYEQEADAMAKQVVHRMHTVQKAPADAAQRQEEEEELQMKPLSAISVVQRQEEEEEALQMQTAVVGATGGNVTPDLEQSIQTARGGGQSIPAPVRTNMEQAFGADFSSVKLHTNGAADSLNRSLSARAFTTGRDIFFRSGEYNPGSTAGQELLAHELTHTVQQGAASVQRRSVAAPQHRILHPLVQRYTVVGRTQLGPGAWDGLDRNEFWRASDDQQMVVKDSQAGGAGGAALQYYYATATVFQAGKLALDNLGSGFSLTQDMGEVVKSPGNKNTLYRVKPTNKDQKNPQLDTGTFRNCDENTRHALGMHRSTGENAFRSVGVESTIFDVPMPALDDQGRATVNDIMAALSQFITGTNDVPQLHQGHITLGELVKLNYKNMPEDARRILATAIGVNQGADPNVGEGVTVINPMSGVGHFAPAIGRSGGDWVSMENDTDQKGDVVDNPNWYMRMYGQVKYAPDNKTVLEDQTFYGEQKRSGGYGAEPMVMKIVPIEQKPQTIEEAQALQKKRTEELVLSLTSKNGINSEYVRGSSEWHRNFVAQVTQEGNAIGNDTPFLELALSWQEAYKDAPPLDSFKEKMSQSAARLITKTVIILQQIQQHIDTLPNPDTQTN